MLQFVMATIYNSHSKQYSTMRMFDNLSTAITNKVAIAKSTSWQLPLHISQTEMKS